MARDFTKNLSNYYSLGVNAIGPLIHGASAISVAMWANLDTIGAAGFDSDHLGVAINGSTAGVAIGVQGTITPKTLRVGGRSVSTDAFQVRDTITGYGTGTWQHIGGVLNFGADTITPYWNGVAENGGAVTFANTTYTNGTPPRRMRSARPRRFRRPPPIARWTAASRIWRSGKRTLARRRSSDSPRAPTRARFAAMRWSSIGA